MNFKKTKLNISLKNIFLTNIFFVFSFFVLSTTVSADVLLPGNINTCGELAISGEYTLTQNISGGVDTCLTISSDNVIINGGGYTISGTGDTAIDARARDISSALTEGAHGYTNLVINDLNISGYTTGLDLSGNSDSLGDGVNNGNGGDGGDVSIYYSYIGSIISNGGDSVTRTSGGLGGNITLTDTDLDISNSTISALGGLGSSSRNTNGGLDLNYTGTITKTNITLSALSFFNNNTTEYGVYVGGTWPMFPGSISSCGTLFGSGTYTLTQDITDITGTCFTVGSNNITIEGDGHSITASSSNTSFAIDALSANVNNLIINNLDIVDFQNSLKSNQNVTLYSDTGLDVSNEYFRANTLHFKSVGVFEYASTTLSDLLLLSVNNIKYENFQEGLLESLSENQFILRDDDVQNKYWDSIASSADGTKVVAVDDWGKIYTSTNSGVTWTARESNRNWNSIASSADGTKLAAVVYNGQIYTSIDSGVTWTSRESVRNWRSITSSADGTKLVAVVYNGQIYTSTDSGATWTARESDRSWWGVASSADGTKLAAIVDGGQIYTSTDSGATWTARESDRYWSSITSSADGVKLAATTYGDQIYISTNSGVTWTPRESSKDWYSVTSSADGTKLIAASYGEDIYISTDSGVTWEIQNTGLYYWSLVSLSADGTKLLAFDEDTGLYTKTFFPLEVNIAPLLPANSSEISIFEPIVSWGSSVLCEYSYNNFATSFNADCSLNGSDITEPDRGATTLSLRGYSDGQVKTVTTSFNFIDQIINISNPIASSTYQNSIWNPTVDYDNTDSRTLTSCYYSYDNFVSTSTANCSLDGSDIIPPPSSGENTLYIKAIDSQNNIYLENVSFEYKFMWVERDVSRNWSSITSSADGTKLAATVDGGQIYTSINSGITWTPREIDRSWVSITSSADGAKLAAVEYEGKIYTSNNSGETWTARDSDRTWRAIASSDNGQNLAAVVNGGYIYTSDNAGETWIERTNSGERNWNSVVSSADGQTLVATVFFGSIYISNDYGETWTAVEEARGWQSVTMTSDGGKIFAVSTFGGYIYVSEDSGLTWTERGEARSWISITSNTDGGKIAAVDQEGKIYISEDLGVTWVAEEYDRNWQSITSSDNGSKIFALGYDIPIVVFDSNVDYISIEINTPTMDSDVINTWSPSVNWASAVSCYYSYDNFVSTSTANCSLNGSDIEPPDNPGTYTLSVYAVNHNGTIGFDQTSFNYYTGFSFWTPILNVSDLRSMAMSIDGKKIVTVVQGGKIHTSTDSGLTWTERETDRTWLSVTSSADGVKLAAVDFGGRIYVSTDSGITWNPRDTSRNWTSITSSADGKILAATEFWGNIYVSTDSGSNWSPFAATQPWRSIASSADGTKIAAVAEGDQIYISTDSGVTWTARETVRNWTSIASSADGTKLVAAANGNGVYTSIDGGEIWTQRLSAGNWSSVTSSADGSRLATAENNGGRILVSEDYGSNWSVELSTNGDWRNLTSSADGTKFLALSDKLYTKNFSSRSINVNILTPTDNTTVSSFEPIISWGTSVLCEYSYNNTDWSTADCDLLGSDIPPPLSAGSKTLYIRGTDANSNQDTDSSTFTLQAFYFCGTLDSINNLSWSNVDNWYSDSDCSVPTNSVPWSPKDLVFILGSFSPVVDFFDSSIRIPRISQYINTLGMTGPAAADGVIFGNIAPYMGTITGNATFKDSSFLLGTVTGNAIFSTDYYSGSNQTGSTFVVNSDKAWEGNVGGNIYNRNSITSEDTLVTSFIFNNSASNLGTINGNATFNNTSPFNIGTVNGTVTLSGLAQTIQGVNNITNLTKVSSVRDTLYLTSGSAINVSGLLNLTGSDQNNLLTIRSTAPNSYAELNISGTSTLNFLRIKDIHNTTSLTDLSNKTVYDDGGNTGFIFPQNSTPVARSGITGSYTPPALPVSRGGTAPSSPNNNTPTTPTPTPTNNNTRSTQSGTIDSFFTKTIAPLVFKPVTKFDVFNNNSGNINAGTTFIPTIFKDFKAPSQLEFVSIPTNFLTNTIKFITSDISTEYNPESKFGVDVKTKQELVKLAINPVKLDLEKNKDNPDMFVIKTENGNTMSSFVTSDKKTGQITQLIKVSPDQKINIALNTQDNSNVKAKLLDKNLNFNKDGISITTPAKPGVYTLSTDSSSASLFIEVVKPTVNTTSDSNNKKGFVKWFKGLFGR